MDLTFPNSLEFQSIIQQRSAIFCASVITRAYLSRHCKNQNRRINHCVYCTMVPTAVQQQFRCYLNILDSASCLA